uniref:Uncharacterized protein n=1 Tax=Arundo donax TaxID=35708 RepID=A0A0A9EKQ8_ARUDO
MSARFKEIYTVHSYANHVNHIHRKISKVHCMLLKVKTILWEMW